MQKNIVSICNKKQFIHFIIGACVVFSCIASLLLFIHPLHSQSDGDIIVTEIMYSNGNGNGGDWVEVMNTSGSAITMTSLKLVIGTTENGTTENTIAVHGSTPATLAAGDLAVIVKVGDATAFTTAYSSYLQTKIYTGSALSLPSKNNTTVEIKKSDNTTLDSIVYDTSAYARRSGISLHRSLGEVFLPAPATPGIVQINPVTKTRAADAGVSVLVTVTGGTDGGNRHFINSGDTINITVLQQTAHQHQW